MMWLTWFVTMTLAVLQGAAPTAPRFDMQVREDFFAGFVGDEARLKLGMDACERVLASQPDHPEALVWHGSGVVFLSGKAFATGDRARGQELFAKGIAEMDRAAALAPDRVGVLAPRGATLLTATRTMPVAAARPLIESALANYEHVLELQAPVFATLGDHPKGELLWGLAEGYHRLGNDEQARIYFERLMRDVPASGHAGPAREWLATGQLKPSQGLGCVGCHK